MCGGNCCERGAQGPQGLQGAKGVKGDKGDQGLPGAQGLTGPQGPIGLTGPAGPAGANGAAGAAGATGPAGPPGTPGVNGTDGADGAMGPVGPAGPTGPIGPAGPAAAIAWTMAHNINYSIANNIDQKIVIIRPNPTSTPGSVTNFTLPVADPALILGRTYYFIGAEPTGTYKITAPAGVIIQYGNLVTTPGGSITFNAGDSIELVYVMDILYSEVWVVANHFNQSAIAPIIV